MLGRICPTASTVRASVAFLEANTFLQIQTAQVHHHKERADLQRYVFNTLGLFKRMFSGFWVFTAPIELKLTETPILTRRCFGELVYEF